MKKIIYKGLTAIVALSFLIGTTSCTDDILDRINNDRIHATDMAPGFIFTHIGMNTSFLTVGGDYNTYLSVAIEYEAGVFGQMYDYDQRLSGPEDPGNYMNNWSSSYANMTYCLDIIDKCSEGGSYEGNYVSRGIAKALLAYNLAIATDLYGDIPWTEACNFAEYKQPKLDKQQDIYTDIFRLLDEALDDLQKTDINAPGSQEYFYSGKAEPWMKAVYAMKARYTMRLLHRSSDQTGDLNKVLDYISKSFASADEELKFTHYDAATSYNPLYVFSRSRDYFAASQSLVDKMVARNDPRVNEAFIDNQYNQVTPDDETFFPAPNGEADMVQWKYNQSANNWAESAPTKLLSYHELLFLKAEAQARLGQDAFSTLEQAVGVAFDNFAATIQAAIDSKFAAKKVKSGASTLSAADAPAYLTSIKSLYDANPLKEIANQKYLAFYGASGETIEIYNDIRRWMAMGENFIELKNPKNAPSSVYPNGMFPLRNVYGSGDTTTNPNVAAAYGDGKYVYNEPVWWAGGSR